MHSLVVLAITLVYIGILSHLAGVIKSQSVCLEQDNPTATVEKVQVHDLFSGTSPVIKSAALDDDFECLIKLICLDISCKFS